MNKLKSIGLICLTTLFLFACGGLGASTPEFDGAYIWSTGDRYIALEELKTSTTQIRKNGMSIMDVINAPKVYYVLDSTPSGSLSSDKTQGIFIKGGYNFNNFSLHELKERKLTNSETLFENKGAATEDKPLYHAGKEISVDKKEDKELGGYFFKIKNELPSGKYVAWIGYSFWIFEV